MKNKMQVITHCCLLFIWVNAVRAEEFVRLVNGTSVCSGRVEVKSDQSWVSVCEGDFDQQDAEVVCRELGCGAPSVFQGAFYGEVKAPKWTKEFHCEGNETVLMDCRTSDSTRKNCSSDKAVRLTCTDIRLVGGTSRCAGILEIKHEKQWLPVKGDVWNLESSAVVCRQLDCGSVIMTTSASQEAHQVWVIESYDCDGSEISLRECGWYSMDYSKARLKVICSDSVSLEYSNRLCSGIVEVKSDQSWVSVCEGDFDQQDAEVVCRELGCGAPLVLKGVLYGEVKAPMWTKEFQCEGNESVLLDCGTSVSTRNTCSPDKDKIVGLACSNSNEVRLVGGTSHCNGTLEIRHQRLWRPVNVKSDWNLKRAATVCGQLDCGSAVSTEMASGKPRKVQLYTQIDPTAEPVWVFYAACFGSESLLGACRAKDYDWSETSSDRLEVTCSESVRLVNGTSLCSGRVEVKSNQSWVSVCEVDFDQQDAEVVCRELGCGAPLVLQGALYGEGNTPMWSKEFQCEGSESFLLDCRTSDPYRGTCSPVKTVGLTCSEFDDVRLVGGTSHCTGTLEVKHTGEWRPADDSNWNLAASTVVCRQLDCGSVITMERKSAITRYTAWYITSACDGSESSLRECGPRTSYDEAYHILELKCSESVKLLNGNNSCSGRLEVKSDQSWVSVCEGDFDQQDAEVVCRELGCGPPLVLQGALYGEAKAQKWSKEFQCEGTESVLMDCRRAGSTRKTCSPDKTVGLTCSDVRLVGGASRCAGTLEIKHRGSLRPLVPWQGEWNQKTSAVMCRQLGCGSAASTKMIYGSESGVWWFRYSCNGSESSLRECGQSRFSTDTSKVMLEVICSESVRLVSGTGLCSGRVELKSNQSWVSVCEDDFDQQDAEVVCREIGCGAPSVLQGALYGEAKAPLWTKGFQCEGSESVLLDCGTSDSTRNTCSPDKTVGLTCSELDLVRLVEGTSHCAGKLEMKHQGEWRPVFPQSDWNLKTSAVVCRQLDCTSALSTLYKQRYEPIWDAWTFKSSCAGSESSLGECGTMDFDVSTYGEVLVGVELSCLEAVRLVNGSSPCSGRVEVKSGHSWVSVCEGDFDQQNAEVVCRELGCGAPSVLQGALYGEEKAPIFTEEFQCEGCKTTESTRNTCSPGKTVGLTCSEPNNIRLVGGTSHCTGRLEMQHQKKWGGVYGESDWNLKSSAVVCRQLNCGSAVSTKRIHGRSRWRIRSFCDGSEASLRECGIMQTKDDWDVLEVTCSESVRLVNGTSLCSGRVEVKSNQSWVSVCEGDFDQQDAEVVCREFGCGPPLVLQGALYGEVKATMWSKEFQCEGSESVLLDCKTSDSTRNTCSPAKTVGLTCQEFDDVRLVDGTSHCNGVPQLKYQGDWRPVDGLSEWNQNLSAVVCGQLNCGDALSIPTTTSRGKLPVWTIMSSCVGSESSLTECATKNHKITSLRKWLICAESVRLVNGTGLCSGRVEVKSNQSWVSVCEGAFDKQDAQVVCRELNCASLSVLQGALFGEGKAPMWTKEFQCEGNESVLLDCKTSGSDGKTCSPDNSVGLTCTQSDDIRLVGRTSHCNGALELKHQGEWRPASDDWDWNKDSPSGVCRLLDCGSVVSTEKRLGPASQLVWSYRSYCVRADFSLSQCGTIPSTTSSEILEVMCSESVRLVNGTSSCSGRVEVKSNQSWVSVCEGDFDQQDAEVVCRELECGAPSVLQGALYGKAKAPVWTKEFQCEGRESVLQDCATSDSARNTCSPDKAVGLACSGPDGVRLVGGTSRCTGRLDLKHQGEWRPADYFYWNMKTTAVVCRQLDCGSAHSIQRISVVPSPSMQDKAKHVWWFEPSCLGSESSLGQCDAIHPRNSHYILEVICSESVRLVNGTGVCSGTVEVKSDRSWFSVCEGDFDQHDAEVVCRELGCGAPSVLQGAFYGEVKAPMWNKEFQCEGNESVLLDCRTSDSTRNTCSPDKAVGLTCSEPDDVRLVGGTSQCAGTVEVKHQGEWRPLYVRMSSLKTAAVVCRQLDCGSVVSTETTDGDDYELVWLGRLPCDGSEASLRECGTKESTSSYVRLKVICSGVTS